MKKIYLITCLLLSINFAFAQTIERCFIGSAGDVLTSDEVELTFAVGELVTETFTTSDLFLTQGFLQTNNTETGFSVNEYFTEFDFTIYPNPASDYIYIEFETLNELINENQEIFVLDVKGRLLKKFITIDKIHRLDITDLSSGSYFIKTELSSAKVFQKINK